MPLYQAEGIVLRTRNLGEADKICVIYSREEGKFSAVARGARRPKSRLLSVSQPFTHARYLLYRGRSLDTVRQGEIIDSFRSVRENLMRMAIASYAAELVDVSVDERQPSALLFETIVSAWTLFANASDPVTALLWFELKLLDQLGYRPELEACVSCGKRNAEELTFSPREGGILCPACKKKDLTAKRISPRSVAQMRHLLNAPGKGFQVLRLSADDHHQIRSLLNVYFDYFFERPLKSRSFLDVLQEMG